MLKHGLVPESCSAGAASTKRCVTESIIVFSTGFTTTGTMSLTDSPCGHSDRRHSIPIFF